MVITCTSLECCALGVGLRASNVKNVKKLQCGYETIIRQRQSFHTFDTTRLVEHKTSSWAKMHSLDSVSCCVMLSRLRPK